VAMVPALWVLWGEPGGCVCVGGDLLL
jgi:hypothetical protein